MLGEVDGRIDGELRDVRIDELRSTAARCIGLEQRGEQRGDRRAELAHLTDESIDCSVVEREDGLVSHGANGDFLDPVRAREAHGLGDVCRDLVGDQDDAHAQTHSSTRGMVSTQRRVKWG